MKEMELRITTQMVLMVTF
jgi:hypothetical protein